MLEEHPKRFLSLLSGASMAISTANQAIETSPSASPASVFVPADEMEATEHFEPLYGLDPLATKEEAIHAMRESLGGNLKQVASKPKSKIADTGHTWTYRCNFLDDNGDRCCNLRGVVKRHGCKKSPMGFSVWVGVGTDDESNPDKKRSCHSNHSPDGFEETGLHRAFRAMADDAFPEGVKGTLETYDLVRKMKKFCLDETDDEDLKKVAYDNTLWERTIAQVRAYLKHKRSKAGVGFKVRSVQDIMDVCNKTPLTIPADYVARSDYQSAQEFADALGIDINRTCLVHLGSGETLNRFLFMVDKMNEQLSEAMKCNENNTAKKHVRSAIMICSPFTLFRLQEVSKLPDGCRIIYRDGTHGTLVDGSKLVVHMVSPDVQERPSQSHDVTSKGLVPYYLVSAEEHKYTTISSDVWAKFICDRLFGTTLGFDWAESDGAKGFIYGAIDLWEKQYDSLKSVLNCNFHVQQKIGPAKQSELRKKCRTKAFGDRATSQMNSMQNCKSSVMFETCMRLILEDWLEEHDQTTAAIYIRDFYGTYPRNQWYYSATGKFILLLQSRATLIFASHFWTISSFLGIQGIYPSGNFCEHHQGDVKGTKDKAGIIDLNVSMLSFVANQAPRLLEHERTRTSHLVAGRRVFPLEPSRTAIAVVRCMRLGVDLVEIVDKRTGKDCWLGNRAHFVGKPLQWKKPNGEVDLSRIDLYEDAVAGKP
jgi:hypothetical protein